MQEETASSKAWSIGNVEHTGKFIEEAAALATQIKGETFPSTSVLGAQVIVQQRAYGAMCESSDFSYDIAEKLVLYLDSPSHRGTRQCL